jgi:hypothetical protein
VAFPDDAALSQRGDGSGPAGDDAFDIQVAADYISYGMAAQGMFIDMFTVDQFNFDKPFIRKGANWRRRCWTGW